MTARKFAWRSARRFPNLSWEIQAGRPSVRVAGVDEVGRGCLAGPVHAGAVVLHDDDSTWPDWVSEIDDSKMLTPAEREKLAPLIEGWVAGWAIGVASVVEIDRVNIHQACLLAMHRALAQLSPAPEHVLVDGKFPPKGLRCSSTAIVKGDHLSLSIAAASILAKVRRDRLMIELEATHPGYGFGEHKGYSTPQHFEALQRLGACELHRRSFAPVAERLGLRAEEQGEFF